ncbi:NAD(P)-binding protein [Alkalicaulis satelles]|uniref:NAD(P)-binding protein n=1 Tax=Alkalicaulis satelles TaxID=2609175 RepID=A0A5M6ZAE6_9PROT|nr:FAD-dependent oxidoreductase [Alkalicaulis satelles]KAA5801673.1 NAD(P)-binding protein [Alkalicaulis satelles]
MTQNDVLVIGAGFSGLEAARRLSGRFSVRVLEARARPGGRALLHTFANGDEVDLGGQWAGPAQHRLNALISDLGASTYPLWNEGDHLVALNSRLKRYRGTIPALPLHVLLDLNNMLSRFEAMAAGIDLDQPWAHAKALDWDRRTVADFMARNGFTAQAREMFAIGIGAVFCAEPHELSLLHALFYARAGGSLDALLSVEGGAQQDRVHGGMGGLAQRMAEGLGDQITYEAPVEALHWDQAGVRAITPAGVFQARRAILALPPSQALAIRFDPVLPAQRDALWRRMPAGACIKCVAQYERPFWREAGLSGQSVGGPAPVRVTFDNTEAGREHGLLLGFIEGDEARIWSGRDPAERRAAVLESFAAVFGEAARHPVDYADQDWTAEPYTRGCYAAFMGPGVWTSLGRHLRAPLGPLHMAGTETAREGYGYFEGALEAAERAAREVEGALKA